MKVRVRKNDKKVIETLNTSKEVQNNERKVTTFVNKRAAYGELRY